jgi:tungstate transport system substrate-binding protein
LLGKGEVGDTVGTDMLSPRKQMLALIAVFCSAVFLAGPTLAQEKSVVVASTTSTKDTGLFEHLLPLFTQKTGIAVNVRAVGTGQALDMARRGDADVLFAHAKSAEQTFVAEGHGVKRYPVMYNDFVLIGPESDPAGIKGMKDIAKALKAIKDNSATFISRGDNSGTHQFELVLWNKDAGINIQQLDGPWYRSVERGMKATLHMARVTDGYVLSDRGTWISLKNKGDLKILVEGDRRMFNQYGVVLVNPNKHPNVKQEFGQAFIDWLVSPEGQKSIRNYKIDGEQLFYPNAEDPNA